MQKYIDKAEILIEAAPYIRKFSGKTVVIKYGGAAMTDPALEAMVMDNIALLSLLGVKPVIVHGGGPAINDMLRKLKIETRFENGLRVTDEETMSVTEMVLSGHVNKKIVALLGARSVAAVGISGRDGFLFKAEIHSPDGTDIGAVGDIVSCNPSIVESLMQKGFVPVISPVSSSETGKSLNVNADTAALKIAETLGASKLVYMTDVPGLLQNIEDPASVISSINVSDIDTLIEQSVISGGMIPKITSAAKAVRSGVGSVHILDGKSRHALLLEIFTDKGVGTVIW
jgi:acetylglutamate kinase